MYEGVDFFGFILFGICWVSWICRFICFTRFERKFSVIFSIFFSCTAPILLSFWRFSGINIRSFWYCPTDLRGLVCCFHLFFFSVLFKLDNFYWFLQVYWLLFLSPPFCYWVHQWAFNFSCCIQFSVLKFLFGSFDVFCFLAENFYPFINFKSACPLLLEAFLY